MSDQIPSTASAASKQAAPSGGGISFGSMIVMYVIYKMVSGGCGPTDPTGACEKLPIGNIGTAYCANTAESACHADTYGNGANTYTFHAAQKCEELGYH